MKKNSLLIWIFCGLSFIGFAQKKADYLLTMKQDTLYGKVLTASNGLAPIQFVYGGHRMNYYPTSIEFFGVFRDNNYRHFKTLRSRRGQAFFVEIMVNDYMKLYKYKEEHINYKTTTIRYVYLVGPSDDKLTVLSSSTFQSTLGKFLKEKPNMLTALRETTFHELPQLIRHYNDLYSEL